MVVPPQKQPEHVGQIGTTAREAYTSSLIKQTADLERLMSLFLRTFTDFHKKGLRDLLKALGSNLNPEEPVQFH